MTKKQFDTTEKPLQLIVSFDPTTGKSKYDYYDYDGTDYWRNKLAVDFPNCHTFCINNNAVIELKKSRHNVG